MVRVNASKEENPSDAVEIESHYEQNDNIHNRLKPSQQTLDDHLQLRNLRRSGERRGERREKGGVECVEKEGE